MQIQGTDAGTMVAMEIRTATLAKDQQEREGQQVLALLDAAATSAPAQGDLSKGSIIDTFA